VATPLKTLAEDLQGAHSSLLADVRKLEQLLNPVPHERLTELCVCLTEMRAQATEHFRYEEEKGYMESIRKREPRLDRAIHHLNDEHGQLTQGLDEIIIKASAATTLDALLRDAIHKWIEQLRQHEGRENKLVQEAFNLDIGPED